VTVILTLPACEVVAGDRVNVMLPPNNQPVLVRGCAVIKDSLRDNMVRITLDVPGQATVNYYAPPDYPIEVHRTYH
jgi:hypothetical protein